MASVAVLTGRSYAHVKRIATTLGISVTDAALWSEVEPMRRLLAEFKIGATDPRKFVSWEALPSRALLAIKWHREKAGAAWHWVAFAREGNVNYVFDSKKALRTHRRTDFGRIKPKWFVEVS